MNNRTLINSGTEFNCILANNNDQMAQAATRLLKSKHDNIPIVSTGGSPDAISSWWMESSLQT